MNLLLTLLHQIKCYFFLQCYAQKTHMSTCRPFCAFVYLTLLRRKFLPQQLIVFLFDMDASSYFLSFCAKKQDLFLLCVTKSSKFVAVVVFCLHIRACCCQILANSPVCFAWPCMECGPET